MNRRINPRVIGASLVGLGLVASAWVLNSLQTVPLPPGAAVSVATAVAPVRESIEISDSDSDGVEDWREPLLTATPVVLNTTSATYTRSNTLTEKVGIALMENYLLAKSTGDTISDVDERIAGAVLDESLGSVNDTPYSNLDITLLPDSSADTLRTYVNAVALIFQVNDLPNALHNLRAFELAFMGQDADAKQQLVALAKMYQKNCLDLLALPTPTSARTEQLALVNTMCAMSKNLTSMVNAGEDPALALLRLKRYQGDEEALAQAVMMLRDFISRQQVAISEADPAAMFVSFGTQPRS